ncbi:MAG TPA: PTS sugar transporter subunit IIA [Chitinispirillaceae bacterium]|nr:PTS sugar transporter subunit IIA [Chitinispirillaceae bacterium]
MKLQELLTKSSIIIDLPETNKNEFLSQMAHFMISLNGLSGADEVAAKILDRESEMSTGIGYGIAIPHARISGIDRLYMVAARSAQGLDFNAIDEQPVLLVFMMISPANTSVEHTQILSSLSRIMSYEEVRIKLLKAEDSENFLDIITKSENKYIE